MPMNGRLWYPLKAGFFILYVGATLGTAPVAVQIVGIWDVDVRPLGGSLENENGKF